MIHRAIASILMLLTITSCGIFFPSSLDVGTVADSELAGVLFINEVSADHPEETDWIELYNSSSKVINLSGFYLSDDATKLVLWEFPNNTYLEGKGYMVITFNGDSGTYNTDFGLRAGVDSLYLSTPGDLSIIDSIATIPETGTASYGRTTDGADLWSVFLTPTKGEPNL